MGYYANGSGSIEFTEVLPPSTIRKLKSYSDPDFDITDYVRNDHTVFDITADGKYHSEDVECILNQFIQACSIVSGEIDYTGEDDYHWRFIWTGDAWVEQNGEIVYEPLEKQFGKVVWTKEDILAYLDDHDIYPNDPAFVKDVVNRCFTDRHFTDTMIQAGWLQIAYHATDALEEWRGGSLYY